MPVRDTRQLGLVICAPRARLAMPRDWAAVGAFAQLDGCADPACVDPECDVTPAPELAGLDSPTRRRVAADLPPAREPRRDGNGNGNGPGGRPSRGTRVFFCCADFDFRAGDTLKMAQTQPDAMRVAVFLGAFLLCGVLDLVPTTLQPSSRAVAGRSTDCGFLYRPDHVRADADRWLCPRRRS